jgi:predicted nicotinamide N-methyase
MAESSNDEAVGETRWTDAAIRWPEDAPKTDDIDEDEEECGFIDPFKDPDPFEIFSFNFDCPSHQYEDAKNIDINIRGFKADADEVWDSTGLTLWRASEYLCEYQATHLGIFQGKRVLELGAGLGLNGILAWRMTHGSTICITDGDTDALAHLRENVERNRPSSAQIDKSEVSCHQLIWGKEASASFLEQIAHGQNFDVLLASDIVYAKCIIEPLWETVTTLLRSEGVFVMAFARRKVPISIQFVLESAEKAGFTYEMAKEDLQEGIWVYQFRFKKSNDDGIK